MINQYKFNAEKNINNKMKKKNNRRHLYFLSIKRKKTYKDCKRE